MSRLKLIYRQNLTIYQYFYQIIDCMAHHNKINVIEGHNIFQKTDQLYEPLRRAFMLDTTGKKLQLEQASKISHVSHIVRTHNYNQNHQIGEHTLIMEDVKLRPTHDVWKIPKDHQYCIVNVESKVYAPIGQQQFNQIMREKHFKEEIIVYTVDQSEGPEKINRDQIYIQNIKIRGGSEVVTKQKVISANGFDIVNLDRNKNINGGYQSQLIYQKKLNQRQRNSQINAQNNQMNRAIKQNIKIEQTKFAPLVQLGKDIVFNKNIDIRTKNEGITSNLQFNSKYQADTIQIPKKINYETASPMKSIQMKSNVGQNKQVQMQPQFISPIGKNNQRQQNPQNTDKRQVRQSTRIELNTQKYVGSNVNSQIVQNRNYTPYSKKEGMQWQKQQAIASTAKNEGIHSSYKQKNDIIQEDTQNSYGRQAASINIEASELKKFSFDERKMLKPIRERSKSGIAVSQPRYNLFSAIDEPINNIISGKTCTCPANQIVAQKINEVSWYQSMKYSDREDL